MQKLADPYEGTANASFYRCVDGVGTREDATEMLRECWAWLHAARDAKTPGSRESCYRVAASYMLVRLRALKEIT